MTVQLLEIPLYEPDGSLTMLAEYSQGPLLVQLVRYYG